MPPIENHLAMLRRKRDISVTHLAAAAQTTRQTIYAIEAGAYVPNTAVALKLARTLNVTVEELFSLPPAPDRSATPACEVTLLPGSDASQQGRPVQLCPVDRHLIGFTHLPGPWYFEATDAAIAHPPHRRAKASAKTRVEVFQPGDDFRDRVLVAGCDPGISVLARHVRSAGIDLVLAHRNSSQALKLLKEGQIHVAGTHLRDEATGNSNLHEIARLFPGNSVAVISFAEWEEGILTARGNPKGIKGIEDLARRDVTIVNRERGAGSRALLDSNLKRIGIGGKIVRGYERLAPGHIQAALQVKIGAGDCCVATRATARSLGLDFLPLVSGRYDFVIRKKHLKLPSVQIVLDTLSRANFRRDLGGLGGYDTRASGQRML
jgi:molybdate-binding protein/DNA-binding XRE family transcriptional regulator